MFNKVKYLLFFVLLFFLISSTVNVFALRVVPEIVYIKSVNLIDNSEKAVELNGPTYIEDSLNVGFDVWFTNVNDYLKYEVVLVNNTDGDYELEKSGSFKLSDYVIYEYELDGDSSTFESQSRVSMFVTLTYKDEVPSTSMENGTYVEENNLEINLIHLFDDNIENPATYDSLMIYVYTFIVALVFSFVLYKYTKNSNIFSVMVLALLCIPVSTKAL